MSETITETPAAPETPTEFLEGVANTAPSQTAEVVETVDAPVDPEPAPKPDKIERRVANLTRKMADADRARAAAEARAEAAEALLRANDPDATPAPKRGVEADIRAEAQRLVAEEKFQAKLSEIDAAGRAIPEWEQHKATMTSFGATGNQAFLQALAETENPAKIFAELADDTDLLMDLLQKQPAAMAARLGRMDAKLATPTARPLSNAPPPAPKVKAAGVVPEPTPYDYPAGMSMKDYNRMMDNWLPPSLGGKKART